MSVCVCAKENDRKVSDRERDSVLQRKQEKVSETRHQHVSGNYGIIIITCVREREREKGVSGSNGASYSPDKSDTCAAHKEIL